MVTVEEVKVHLKIDHADDDGYITGLIAASKAVAQNYMGRKLTDFDISEDLDEFDNDDRACIKHALLILIGEFYDQDRSGYVVTNMKETKAFERLLNPYIKIC
jgi:uncharacterized phage protein (predicted DNA packaging)